VELEVLTASPSGVPRETPLLLVHGGWHGAWCWAENFLPFFAAHGYVALALSLRGHGRSSGALPPLPHHIVDYIEDVTSVSRIVVERYGRPPAIIAHSLGGFVVQHYLQTNAAPAAVLIASVPHYGLKKVRLQYFLRHPIMATMATLTHDPHWMVRNVRVARDAFFSRAMPRDQVERFYAQLDHESYWALNDLLHGPVPDPAKIRLPLLVLGGELDRLIPAGDVRATGEAYGSPAIFLSNIAHDMMIEPEWPRAAEFIRGWLEKSGV
jgi:hypothetical protein